MGNIGNIIGNIKKTAFSFTVSISVTFSVCATISVRLNSRKLVINDTGSSLFVWVNWVNGLIGMGWDTIMCRKKHICANIIIYLKKDNKKLVQLFNYSLCW